MTMNFLPRLLLGLLLALSPWAVQAATIDKMLVAPFGQYDQSYSAGGSFMVFPQALSYQLSDGSRWSSGAGWHPDTQAALASVSEVDGVLTFRFVRPADGILFQNTDYDSGDHSAQGVLGAPKVIELVAKVGSTHGTLKGRTLIVSNDETWYGQPRFNFYSAAVGQKVPFKLTVTLLGGQTFHAGLFDGSFGYRIAGQVDFTRPR